MHHSRSSAARLFAASALLALGGAALWQPPRGLAQEDTSRPRTTQSAPTQAGGSADDTSQDSTSQDTMQPSDAQTGTASDTGSSGISSSANSDAGGDSGLGPNGRTAPNPPVGVDTAGRADATATRTGRTTRRRLPAPQNPIVITNPIRGTGSTALTPDTRNGRLPLPAPSRAPGDYTIPTDPFSFGARRVRPLPLFGYDFFQPARQIILARRRALLPRPTTRRSTANGSQTRTNRTGTGAGSTSQNDTSQNYPDNGNAQGSGSNGPGSDQTGAEIGAGAGAVAAVAGSQGRGAEDVTGGDTSTGQNGTDGGSGDTQASPDGSADGSNNYDGSVPSNGNGSDANTIGTQRRRRTSNAGDTQADNGGFPGDSNTPNGDVQFPGDDALVQGGTANAQAGQIADPLATLTQGVLASLPPNYQLQPGDSLTIRYSALTVAPREFNATVDFQGGVSIAEVGRISVVGRTSAQAEDALRSRLSRLYRNVDVSISLRQIRTIQVTVSGAAFAPGTYTVPATATAFNLLNAAGGPTANGSLRDIRVLRNGRPAGILDIYPLIGAVSPNPRPGSGDITLRSGDNIYVPAPVKRVSVRGEVRQEAIYELTQDETLSDALAYAGGVKGSGVQQSVHIDTIRGTDRVIKDVNLRDRIQVARTPLFDGDSVEIASVRAILTNRVTIVGAVQQPADYALFPGMRLLDLVSRANGPLYDAYLDRADLVRLNPDNTTRISQISLARALDGDATQNPALARFDRVRVYSRQEVAYLGRRIVTVRGAVQRPGTYTQSDNMRVSDLLLGSGGPLPDAYLNRAILLHQHGDGTFAYQFVSLRAILDGGDVAEDLPVSDNDVLAVYRIGEAHFTPDHTVKVLGDVVAPGLYARGEGMKLSDLLKVAGAFKPGGGTRVTVAHARRPITEGVTQVAPVAVVYNSQGASSLGTDVTLEDGDVVAVQGDGSIKDHPAVVTVTGAVNRPGPIIVSRGMRLSDAIKEAGGLRPEAFPQGSEFTRTADTLVTTGQSGLAQLISQMSDMLNLTQYQRERAKANLELITAAGTAASGAAGSGIAGLGGSQSANPANPNLGPLIQNLTQNNLVSQGRVLTPSQLQPNGSVAVRLAEALRRPGGTEDFLVKDGDTLVVPETPTTVQIVGAVFNARGVLFKPGQPISYYIERAGDTTPDAAKDRIEVIHAGGGLIPASKAGAVEPGDLILVPTKVLAEKVSQSGGGFNAFFQGLVGSAITLKVLGSVFGL